MGQLTYLPDRRRFFYKTETDADLTRARAAALSYLPQRPRVFVSDEPYEVLEFYDEGDTPAKAELAPLHDMLDFSRATEYDVHAADFPAPEGLAYMPYQRAGIAYALEQDSDILFGDAPGCGKTIEAIGFANTIGARKVLVVCPGSVRPHWEKTVRQWSTIPKVKTYKIEKSSDGVNPLSHYVIISYDLIRNPGIWRALKKLGWDLVVLDEAHYLKTVTAKRTQAIFGGTKRVQNVDDEGIPFTEDVHISGIAASADRVIALTGTPLPNRPRECYTLVRNMCWDAIDWVSEEAFKHRFNPSGTFGRHTEERSGRLAELQARLRCNLMVRRLKEDVLPQLPEKRYELVQVLENGGIKEALAVESLLDIDMSQPNVLDTIGADMELRASIAEARRLMGEAKVPRVIEHIEMLFNGGVDKVVVFGYHRDVLAALAGAFEKRSVMLRGGMTPTAKQKAIDVFIHDSRCQVFVAQLTVGGIGIDGLQHVASHVVFAEADWVPGNNDQAVDRLHRHGQSEGVLAQFLVAPGSIDEMILGRAIEKLQTTHKALDRRP